MTALQSKLAAKLRSLNNDNLSIREKADLKTQLKNVKEVLDPTKEGAVFEIGTSVQHEKEPKTTEYIPKEPVMEHISRLEAKHAERIQ